MGKLDLLDPKINFQRENIENREKEKFFMDVYDMLSMFMTSS